MRTIDPNMSPREYQQFEHDKEIMSLQMAHQKAMKAMELEVAKLETKFSVWLKIPLMLLLLPVKILLVIPVVVYAAKGKEVPEKLWNLLS